MDGFNPKRAALDGIREMARKAMADRVKKKALELAPAPEGEPEGDEAAPSAADLTPEELQALLEEYGKEC